MDIDYAAVTVTQQIDDVASEILRAIEASRREEEAIPIPQMMREYGYDEQLQQIADGLRRYLASARKQTSALSGPGANYEIKENRDRFVNSKIKGALDDVGQAEGVLTRLATLINMIDLRAAKAAVKQAAAKALSWLSIIGTAMKNISRQLWAMLASLMTPKEWKLGGKIGSGPFNLADVTVEITFGDAATGSS